MKTKSKKKKKQKYYYSVSAIIYDENFEAYSLEEVVGKKSCGHGCGIGGEDINWDFKHLRQALPIYRKLLRIKAIDSLILERIRE